MSLASGVRSHAPAILGGDPQFDSKVPIVRPALPDYANLADGMREMFRSGMITKGAHLSAFEEAIAAHLGVRHAVAVSSGTTGLMLTYKCLGLSGDVLVPSWTFLATVAALVWNGVRPVFADVDLATNNLDPASIEEAITPRTTAIVAVHNFGNPCDIAGLEAVARRHGLKLIFDAANAFGSLYQGVPVGSQGDAQVYSLSPTKLLIAGEGGIVATNDERLAEGIRRGREYGMTPHYDSLFAGVNARMSEMHAQVGLASLHMLEGAVQRRQELASMFRRELGTLPGIGFQHINPGDRCSYKDFSITIDAEQFGLSRDELGLALSSENIDTRKYWYPPVHKQTAYQQFAPAEGALANTNELADTSLSLPLWSRMDDAVVEGICQAIRRVHQAAAEIAHSLRTTEKNGSCSAGSTTELSQR